MKKFNINKMTDKEKEQLLKTILDGGEKRRLLYESINCWKKGTSGGLTKEQEDFYNHCCDACDDERKRICELFQRFEMAITRTRKRDNKEAVAHINFVNGLKNLTDFYYE